MKKHLIIAAALSVMGAASTRADTVYTYTGVAYTTGPIKLLFLRWSSNVYEHDIQPKFRIRYRNKLRWGY